MIDKLRTAIIAKTNPLTTLTPLEMSILKLSSLPLARYAALTYSSGIVSGAANAMQSDIAQLVALEAATNFVRLYSQLFKRQQREVDPSLPISMRREWSEFGDESRI